MHRSAATADPAALSWAHPHSRAEAERRPWTVLVLVAVAQFMVILDITVVNVALPSIGQALAMTAADLQWVVSAYVLFTGGLMLLGGRLSDLLGRRRIFLAGLTLFTGASLASGLAWSAESLIAARALQGVGAALLLPSALSIITTVYSGRQRTVALSVWGALGSAGAAAGVLLGGVLTTALSWEWIFFINVPVGVVVGAAISRQKLDDIGTRPRGPADVAGGLALMLGLFGLVYTIQGTSGHGWTSARTLSLLGASVVLLAGFVVLERRAPRPLVPPSTWRVRSLVSSAGVMLGATGVLVGTFFLSTLYLQEVLGASALEAGLGFLPLTLVILLAAHGASHLLPRLGTRAVVVSGLGLATVGALLLTGASSDGSYVADVLPGFLALGFGIGLTLVAVSIAAMADVEQEQAGLASGLMTTGHELGGALGVAVLAAVATGAGASGSAVDHGDGFLAAAAVAGMLALVALVAVPAVRPAPGSRVSMH